jgi:lipopolysaccharide biosynthesis regulator YciM
VFGPEIIFLLLPVAAFSGWLLGRKGHKNRSHKVRKEVSDQYFKGLNYLLSDQDDKAIDLFIKISEFSEDTIEVQFALANLFKKRGEVDRAIRIHQNLIAKPSLDRHYHNMAVHELALDYLKAGLFDRAESLFLEVRNVPAHKISAHKHLIEIYQQEKEWEQAISIAQSILREQPKTKVSVAHYYCELAEYAITKMEYKIANRYIKQALAMDSKCARASILEGRVFFLNNQVKKAIKSFKNVEHQDPELISEIIKPLYQCFNELRTNNDDFAIYIKSILEKHDSVSIAIAIADLRLSDEHNDKVSQLLDDYLLTHPSILSIKHFIESDDFKQHDNSTYKPIKNIISRLWTDEITYQCRSCGLHTKNLHWQCPGCKTWSSIKPIHQFDPTPLSKI